MEQFQNLVNIKKTRRYGRYAPILLAPAEGWGPFRLFWGPSAPSRVHSAAQDIILNIGLGDYRNQIIDAKNNGEAQNNLN